MILRENAGNGCYRTSGGSFCDFWQIEEGKGNAIIPTKQNCPEAASPSGQF
jgi:hypothetical protein